MLQFRLLRADEIEARIAQCGSWGVQLLLYKDARCDMNILDETVGCLNWQRHHSRDNANCIVSIWDEEKKQWIEKEDTGTESNTEKEKGIASDSFKRACFNLGIGRELYTSPKMFIRSYDLETLKENNGRWTCKDFFVVIDIQYNDRKIASVTIQNMKTGKTHEFSNGKPILTAKVEKVIDTNFLKAHGKEPITQREIDILTRACANEGENMTISHALRACNRERVEDINYIQYVSLCGNLHIAA